MNLEKFQNFAFKLKQPIPEGKKARLRILCEKRFGSFAPNSAYITDSNCITIALSNGKKLSSEIVSESSHCTLTIPSTSFCFSYQILHYTNIFTFVIHYKNPSKLVQKFYIRVFCEYDFDLYDIDYPNKLFPEGEKPFPVFDNFTISDKEKALALSTEFHNYKNILSFKEPTLDDLDENRNQKIADIINKTQQNASLHHYSHYGAQLNLANFTIIASLTNDLLGDNYVINNVKENGNDQIFTALISRYSIDHLGSRFSEELSIRQEMNYPSIVKLYGYSEKDFKNHKNPVFITEYYSKGSLLKLLQNNEDNSIKLNNTQKMIILIGVAFAMHYIHQKRIIHYDLKCSGIYLDDNYYPKVGDFGFARYSNAEPRKWDKLDKPYIIAPEIIIANKDKCSFPVDVFAYAMVFYHVVSNKMPMVQYTNTLNLYCKITKEKARPDLSCIPEKFHPFLNSLWSHDPELRPTFKQIIDYFLEDQEKYWLDDVDKDKIEEYIVQLVKQ